MCSRRKGKKKGKKEKGSCAHVQIYFIKAINLRIIMGNTLKVIFKKKKP